MRNSIYPVALHDNTNQYIPCCAAFTDRWSFSYNIDEL
jgi:hypothetical protein